MLCTTALLLAAILPIPPSPPPPPLLPLNSLLSPPPNSHNPARPICGRSPLIPPRRLSRIGCGAEITSGRDHFSKQSRARVNKMRALHIIAWERQLQHTGRYNLARAGLHVMAAGVEQTYLSLVGQLVVVVYVALLCQELSPLT